jgi:hypothetical protein
MKKVFDGWFVKQVAFGFSYNLPKFLIIYIHLGKKVDSSPQNLQDQLWEIKRYPEFFVQKLPRIAKNKLVVHLYDEKFFIEPTPYPQFKLLDSKGELLYRGGKEVRLSLFLKSADWFKFEQEHSKVVCTRDNFIFSFFHPLSGKDESDKLYQLTKDRVCAYGEIDGFFEPANVFGGKYCSCPFNYFELLPYILKSMHKQFDFKDSAGKRMDWYEELLLLVQEVPEDTALLPTFLGKEFLHNFFRADYKQAIVDWEVLGLDPLWGEDL